MRRFEEEKPCTGRPRLIKKWGEVTGSSSLSHSCLSLCLAAARKGSPVLVLRRVLRPDSVVVRPCRGNLVPCETHSITPPVQKKCPLWLWMNAAPGGFKHELPFDLLAP